SVLTGGVGNSERANELVVDAFGATCSFGESYARVVNDRGQRRVAVGAGRHDQWSVCVGSGTSGADRNDNAGRGTRRNGRVDKRLVLGGLEHDTEGVRLRTRE